MVSNPFSQGLSVKVGGDVSGATTALAGLRGSLVKTSKRVTALGGLLGGALAVGGIAKAVGSAADFDEKMQESMAVMGDVSEVMREDLEKQARDVANTTTASAEQAAESYYFLASAGLDASQSLEAMPTVAEFAEAGNLDMATATDYATDIMKAFGKEADEMGSVTDKLTGVVTRHNQTMNGMGQAMSMVAPIASGLGVSVEETATMIGFLGDAGIKGSRAGRTLRQAFNRLNNVSGPAKETLEELGVSVQDGNGEMRDMSDIIEDLNDAGANTADVMEIFGARAGPGMQILLDQGAEALENETEKIGDMEGKTEEVARTQRQTFNKQLEILRSRLNDVAITIGNKVLPLLTPLLERFNDFVSNSRDIGNAISKYVQPSIETFIGGLDNLFTTAQESDSLSEFIKTLISDATSWLGSNGLDLLKGVGTSILSGIASALSPDGGGDGAANILNALVKRIKSALTGIDEWLKGGGKEQLQTTISNIMGGLATALDNVSGEDISAIFDKIKSILRSVFDLLISSAQSDEAKSLGGSIGRVANTMMSKLTIAIAEYVMSDAFVSDLKAITMAIANIWYNLIDNAFSTKGLIDAAFGEGTFEKVSSDMDLTRAGFGGGGGGSSDPRRNINIKVEGDTGVIKQITAEEIETRERRVNRQTGRKGVR